MIITLGIVKDILLSGINPIKKSRVYGGNKINNYMLEQPISIMLSNGTIINIPKGYVWNGASSPRLLWSVFPPDSDAEIAYLIHDYLYDHKVALNVVKSFADNEMLLWEKATNSTKYTSIKNISNTAAFIVVTLFGKKEWND
jgi:hypothetical protein